MKIPPLKHLYPFLSLVLILALASSSLPIFTSGTTLGSSESTLLASQEIELSVIVTAKNTQAAVAAVERIEGQVTARL